MNLKYSAHVVLICVRLSIREHCDLLTLDLTMSKAQKRYIKINIIYIIMLLHNLESVICSDKREYSIKDQVFSCSKWLSSIIFSFCNNEYKIVKRDTSTMIEKMAPKDLQMETSRRRLVDEGHWRRVRRQVASECCNNPCTVADIIMYCPDNAKLLEERPDIFD